MNIQVVKRGLVAELRDKVSNNLERYLEGDFTDILKADYVIPVKDTEIDIDLLNTLIPRSGGDVDAENALIVRKALKGLTRYLARDERVWVYLTHGPCLKYARERWINAQASDAKKISLIKDHFFATGARGFERNNAIACLWWWSEIATRYQGTSLEYSLKVFLHQTDMRASIVERPTTSQNPTVFSAIMNVLVEKYESDLERNIFFKRSGHDGVYRRWLKEINRHGGTQLYEAIPVDQVTSLFRNLAAKVEAASS